MELPLPYLSQLHYKYMDIVGANIHVGVLNSYVKSIRPNIDLVNPVLNTRAWLFKTNDLVS